MVRASLDWWLKTKYRRMSGMMGKPQLFVLGFVVLILWLFFAKLSHLQTLQEKCVSTLEEVVKEKNKQSILPSTSATKVATVGPKFWLSAKNADGSYLQHVRNLFKYLGYSRVDGLKNDWDVLWAYEYPFSSVLRPEDLKPHQLVNHFPGCGYLTSKVYLATSKHKYIPTAFSLPKEKDAFLEFADAHKEKLWVQKSNKHRGISIRSIGDLDLGASETFVQEYVSNPFLVDGRKFDIGIYTIITSIDPLRIYVYDAEWLIRYCPEDYYPLDVHNPNKYVVGDDYTPTWELPSLREVYNRLHFSHKRSLAYYIKKKGHDFNKLQEEVYNAIAEITLEKKPDIVKSVARYPYGSKSFFEMVRFDFVFDADMNVYLMEVNMSPNLSSAHFKPNAVMYEQVILNTLSLAGLSHASNLKNDIDATLVNNRNIEVYGEECLKCNDCHADLCKLCLPCLSDSLKDVIKAAYREHVSQLHTKRIYPKALHIQSPYSKYNGLTQNDKLMHLWYRGMCISDKKWCVQ